MDPETLHNQLRFNLSVPCAADKLSVRHEKPRPIVIEKTQGPGVQLPKHLAKTTANSVENVEEKFHHLDISKLKEAQFLARRDLKRQKHDQVSHRNVRDNLLASLILPENFLY